MRFLLNLFNPNLPRRMWLLQLGVLVNFFGNGLVAPFLVIYLHFGRGIPLGAAGSAVALGGVTAVSSGLVAGLIGDRFGPRNILAGAMVSNALAYLMYTQVSATWEALAAGLLVGVGTGMYGPMSQNLTASMVPAENLAAAFAQNRLTAMVGLGTGGLVGGLIAAAGLPGYLRLLQLDALTFLLFTAITFLLPSGRSVGPAARGGYGTVLQDGPFLRLVLLSLVMVSAGIAPMLWLLPAFAKIQAHVGETAIGAIYAVSTLTIVVAQLPITRFARGRNRMRLLRFAAVLWAAFWLVCLAAGTLHPSALAAVIIGSAAVVYAIGDCLYTAIVTPTAVALAPEHLRGRYLGAMGFAWQGGFLIGPSLGGAVLGFYPVALPLVCVAGCLVAAALTTSVDRSLSPGLRRSPAPVAA